MQLHKNRILIFSALYVASLIVIASLFGMWHNGQLTNSKSGYLVFLLLLILLMGIISYYYFEAFKNCKKEIEEEASKETALITETEKLNETSHEEEKVNEIFDKDAFISAILPTSKKSVNEYCEEILQRLAGKLGVVQGLFFIKPKDGVAFEPVAQYAYYSDKTPPSFNIGETLSGQTIKDKRVIILRNIPENYIPVISGLGSGKPKTLIMIPILTDSEPVGLIEIAVFTSMAQEIEPALKELGAIIGKNIIKLMK